MPRKINKQRPDPFFSLLDEVGEGNNFTGGFGFGGAIETVVESERGLHEQNPAK